MRLLLLAVLAGAAACARPAAPARCDLQATQALSFTAPDSRETVTAQTIGVSCDKTIGLFVVRDAENYPLWSWSAPLAHGFGDVFVAEDSEQVQMFLDRWAQPEIATTQSAPAWDALTHGQTTLDRLTYEDIRARDLPMLCHFSGTARQTCVFWEPAAGGAGHLLDQDVEESEE